MCTRYWVLGTMCRVLSPVYCMLCTEYCALRAGYLVLHTVCHVPMYCVLCAMYLCTVYCVPMYCVLCAMCLCTVYCVPCAYVLCAVCHVPVYCVLCAMCHCVLCAWVLCTMYNALYIKSEMVDNIPCQELNLNILSLSPSVWGQEIMLCIFTKGLEMWCNLMIS